MGAEGGSEHGDEGRGRKPARLKAKNHGRGSDEFAQHGEGQAYLGTEARKIIKLNFAGGEQF